MDRRKVGGVLDALLLLGWTVFEYFGKIEIDNYDNEIIIK